ncbi:MAG: hypothetical protein H0V89_14785 [Deltaproteobacteria bacterium]|nr:hypothetical protein [Deltaproteobacteria bacterium]
MTVWQEIANKQDASRKVSAKSLATALRKRLTDLGTHVDPTIQGRLTIRQERARTIIEIQGGNSEPLSDLEHVRSATLAVHAAIEEDTLREFTLRLDWVRPDETAGVIAIHLDPEPRGTGACGHPLLHCHVGPDLDTPPKVRVPFPPVSMPDALDWLLSQILPGREPEPWTSPTSATRLKS